MNQITTMIIYNNNNNNENLTKPSQKFNLWTIKQSFLRGLIVNYNLGHQKRKPVCKFYRWMDLQSRVGRLGQYLSLIFFFFLVAKMTPLKIQKSQKKK